MCWADFLEVQVWFILVLNNVPVDLSASFLCECDCSARPGSVRARYARQGIGWQEGCKIGAVCLDLSEVEPQKAVGKPPLFITSTIVIQFSGGVSSGFGIDAGSEETSSGRPRWMPITDSCSRTLRSSGTRLRYSWSRPIVPSIS